MRYLFRGKRVDNGEWVYGFLAYLLHDKAAIAVPVADAVFDYTLVIPETVGQWTGLEDKNGVKIFEEDVVKFCHWNDCDTNKEREWKIGQIIWDYSSYRFALRPETPMNSLYSSKMYDVIGNTHDDNSLLK